MEYDIDVRSIQKQKLSLPLLAFVIFTSLSLGMANGQDYALMILDNK